jgi:hypothetical protein
VIGLDGVTIPVGAPPLVVHVTAGGVAVTLMYVVMLPPPPQPGTATGAVGFWLHWLFEK